MIGIFSDSLPLSFINILEFGNHQGSQSRRYNITVFYGSGLYFGPKVPYGCCAGHSTAHFPSHGFWREFKLMNSGNIPVFLDSKESELT